MLVPVRHHLPVAEEFALSDFLCNGRAQLSVGWGDSDTMPSMGRVPKELSADFDQTDTKIVPRRQRNGAGRSPVRKYRSY